MNYDNSGSPGMFQDSLGDLRDALGFDEFELSYVDRCIENPKQVRDKIRSL